MAMKSRTEAHVRIAHTVGKNVLQRRTERGLTQAALAAKVREGGYPLLGSAVCAIERGRHNGGQLRSVSVDELVHIARALGISPASLLSDPEET